MKRKKTNNKVPTYKFGLDQAGSLAGILGTTLSATGNDTAGAVGGARQHLRGTQYAGRCHGRAWRPKATQVRVWPQRTGPPDDPRIRRDHDWAGRLAGAEQARLGGSRLNHLVALQNFLTPYLLGVH